MTANTPTATHTVEEWGETIQPEVVRGIPFRTYVERPKDITHLLHHAARWGDRPHLVHGERVLTFEQLEDAVQRKAGDLVDRAVRPGEHVLLMGFNSIEWIVNFWAILVAGGIPVLGNAWWSEPDVRDAIELLSPSLVLADDRARARLPESVAVGTWELASGARTAPRVPPIDEDDPAVVVFTSGTSGRPKAVVLSHRSVLAGLHMLLAVTRRLPHLVDEATGDVALHTGPMFHIGGIQTLIRAIVVGDTLVMPAGRFDAEQAVELIEKWKIARWSAVPTMLQRVLDLPDTRNRDLSSLKSVTAGGAPVHPEFIAALRTQLPGFRPRVATGYGLTENGGQATAASGKDTATRAGSSGRALPCVDMRIANPDIDGIGEIELRSPTQMVGYYGIDESPIDADGWLATGDLGRIDADGYLWITGRVKDLIIRGGENIAPASVEEGLSHVEGIVESTVFGVPHPQLGEEVVAVVFADRELSGEQIAEALRGRIPSFAVPTRWDVRREPLEVNHSGKIDKPRIRADYLEALAPTKEDE